LGQCHFYTSTEFLHDLLVVIPTFPNTLTSVKEQYVLHLTNFLLIEVIFKSINIKEVGKFLYQTVTCRVKLIEGPLFKLLSHTNAYVTK
jgi:hypothetical protein